MQMNTIDFNGMASKYGLDAAFVQSLHEKIVDKENFTRAVRMFVDGTLPYDVAMGDAPINIAELRHQVAQNLLVFRKHKAEKVRQAMEQQRKIVDYYNGCQRLVMHHRGKKQIREMVAIKDGIIVAFGHYEPNQGGIYAANNPVMPDFHWQPHDALARLRKLDKAFYRKVKKAASNSPKEWFDFTITTIAKQ